MKILRSLAKSSVNFFQTEGSLLKKTPKYIIGAILVLSIAIILFKVFDWKTGFYERVIPKSEFIETEPGKTLWDWLELMIIPLALFAGGYILNKSEKRREERLAKERREADLEIANERFKTEKRISEIRNQEVALSEYLDRMSNLMLGKKDLYSDAELSIANTRTFTAIRRLDGERNAILIRFLKDSGLVKLVGDKPQQKIRFKAIMLNKMNLTGCPLNDIDFFGSDFSETNLTFANGHEASFGSCVLNKTIMETAFLEKSFLKGASILESNFKHAFMDDTILRSTYIRDSSFEDAHLWRADFSESKIFNTSFFRADLLGTIFDKTCIDGCDFTESSGLSNEQLSTTYYTNTPPILPDWLNPVMRKNEY